MKRWLLASALATLCLSLTASAAWTGLQIPGTPVDAEIFSSDGGLFTMATTAGAFEVKNGGITRSVTDAGVPFVNATLDSTNCLVGATGRLGTNAKFISSCPVAVRSPGMQDIYVLRHTPSGGAFATGKTSTSSLVAWYDPSPNAFSDAFINPFVTANDLLTALDVGGQQRVLYLDKANKKLFFSTQNQGNAKSGVDPVLGDARELSSYLAGPQNPVALIGANVTANSPSALYRSDIDAGTSLAIVPITLPGTITSVGGVSFSLGTSPSPALADGFGMATAKTATGEQLLRARPGPNNQADDWVPFNLPPELDGGLARVLCRDGLFCVALTDRDAGVNVFTYVNTAGPALSYAAAGTMKGGKTLTIQVAADDPDQDPVYSSAGALNGPSGPGLVLSKQDAGTWNVDGPDYCGAPTALTFSADFTDGVHIPATASVQVTVVPDDPAAVLLSTSTVNLQAGEAAQTVTATPGVGGCPAGSIDWGVVDLGTSGVSFDGGAFDRTFTPPLHLCSATGATAQFSVIAISDAGLSSPPTPLTVNVAPWGPPDPPFSAPQTVLIDAGSAFTLNAGQTHFCPTAPVSTFWASAAAADSGITLDGLDTSVARSFDGGALLIQTSECTDSTVQLLAHNDTLGQVSPDVAVTVRSVPNIVATNVGIGTFGAVVADGGIVVTVGPDYPCAGALGYGASLSLSRGVQSFGEQARVDFSPTPSTVTLPLPDCAGGTFTVTATLTHNGASTPIVRSVDVTAAPGDVPAPEVLVSDVTVACGVGGSAALTVIPKASCPDLSYTWSAGGEVPLTITPQGDGSEATVSTVSPEVSDVIGRIARLHVTAVSGGRQLSSTDVPIQFTSPTIVKLTHSTDTPIASDTELFGVEVTLTNKLSCDLHGVALVETLRSMTVVPASVRVNGAPVDESRIDVGSHLRISGLDVPAGAPTRVHFSGKPLIEGTPKPTGVAVFPVEPLDYRISDEAGFGREANTAPPVCGCGEMSGLSLLALLSVTWFGRRRRGRFQ